MHVMLDLETMGNGANSAIIAIGAVAFDDMGINSRFYEQVSLASCVSIDLECDASTIMWWMQQSNEARSAFRDNDKANHIVVFWLDLQSGLLMLVVLRCGVTEQRSIT